jgi:hypothetical protein
VTGSRAALPGHAGPAGHDSHPARGCGVAGQLPGSGAERLLIGASVYREPADRNALLFQVGQHDWAAVWPGDRQGPVPPYRAPGDLDDMIAACEAAGLMTVGRVPSQAGARHARAAPARLTFLVDPPAARDLHRALDAAGRGHELAAAHRSAAAYWRWRAAAWPQGHHDDVHDLLEARHHLLAAGETIQAREIKQTVRSMLHKRGKVGREAAPAGDTLAGPVQPGPQPESRPHSRPHSRLESRPESRPQPEPRRMAPAENHPPENHTAQNHPAQSHPRQNHPAQNHPPQNHPPQNHPSQSRPAGLRARWRRADLGTRWRLSGLAGLVAALLSLCVAEVWTGLAVAGGPQPPRPPGARPAAQSAATVRQQAAAWIAAQISRSAIVACDPVMCSELQLHGVPPGDLLMLGPAVADPLGSDVVVATAAVRSEFGRRLAGVYAPAVLAGFGAGAASIQVRMIAPDGVAAYRGASAADLASRRQAGAELLANSGISVAAGARRPLSAGVVDSRLLITLAALAALRRMVRVLSFGPPDPDAGAGVPLRSMEITGPAPAAVLAFLRAQQAPYLPAVMTAGRLPDGQKAVRIGYAGPSPLGLLGPARTTAQPGPPS